MPLRRRGRNEPRLVAVSAARRLMENLLLDRDCKWFGTQGGAARLRRLALPWAVLFDAFGVRNDMSATSNLTLRAYVRAASPGYVF